MTCDSPCRTPDQETPVDQNQMTKDALALLREAHDNCRGGHRHTIVSDYWLDRVKALLDEARRKGIR
jgi:hypothetical protein